MVSLISAGGISIFGFFTLNPVIFTFLLFMILFGGMNIIEFKRFD